MGPALQVHTPKKQRGAPCGAPRVFRPCVAQTEEGYIRRLMQAGTAREIPPDVERIRSAYLEIV